MKLLVIGSSNMDMVIDVEEIPIVGETVIGRSVQYLPGGKGANQAYACAMLGGHTTFLTALGRDDFGSILRGNLAKAGVDMQYTAASGLPTGTAVIYVNRRGNNCIVVVTGANDDCDTGYIQANIERLRECDLLLVQMEVPQSAVYYAVETAARLGKKVILNPAPAPDKLPDRIYPLLHYITPNETELQKLTGCPVDTLEEIQAAAGALLQKGAGNILVTLGAKGAMLVNRDGARHFMPPDIPVVDTTAAGDTFNAAIAVALCEGKSIEQAIEFANLAGTIAVSRRGAQASVPSREEIRDYAASLGKTGLIGG